MARPKRGTGDVQLGLSRADDVHDDESEGRDGEDGGWLLARRWTIVVDDCWQRRARLVRRCSAFCAPAQPRVSHPVTITLSHSSVRPSPCTLQLSSRLKGPHAHRSRLYTRHCLRCCRYCKVVHTEIKMEQENRARRPRHLKARRENKTMR